MKSLVVSFFSFFTIICACRLSPNLEAPTVAPANLRLVVGPPAVLIWDAVKDAESYTVYRSCVPDDWPDLNDAETEATQIQVSENGYYAVAAKTEGGEGPKAFPPVLLGPPAPPLNVTVRAIGAQFFLTWRPATCATSYVVYRSLDAAPDPFPAAFGTSVTAAFQVFPRAPTYYYWVAAQCSTGEESRIAFEDAISF